MKDKLKIKVKEPIAQYGEQHTYADYLKFEFDHMVELIRGKIFKMTPAPSSGHQAISIALGSIIFTYLKDKKCKVFDAPFDVVLPVHNQKISSATTVVQPDICVICDLDKIDNAGCNGAPDLIVEILSPSTSKKDLNDKYSIYEEAGVKEYWIAMPQEKLVEVFYLENGKYQRIKAYTSDEVISPILFPDLKIQLQEVFADLS